MAMPDKYIKNNNNKNFRNFLCSKKGTSIVLFAMVFSVITAIASLSIDTGIIAFEKAKLSATIDSATLAGAQELAANSGNTANVINEYISKNNEILKEADINIDLVNRTVEVTGVKTVNNIIAGFFGKNNEDVTVTAKASIENIKSLGGARPLAVVQQVFEYGRLYTLKEGGGDGTTGNYAAVALGGTGGSVYRDNLLYGYSDTISVGDVIETETGNIAGITETSINHLIQECTHNPACTYQSYSNNCSRIIFIPVVDTLEVNGRKYIKVLGFGTFFLEGVQNKSGQADVIGRFITYSMQGETANDIGDFGTYSIRLVK